MSDRNAVVDEQVAAGPGPARILITVGNVCVVLGGLVAAATGPLDLPHGSWLAAYLVLVGGASQCAMGSARHWGPGLMRPNRSAWVQIGSWNLGNAAVIAGTLAGAPIAVDLGSVLLVVALAVALRATRKAVAERVSPTVVRLYRAVLLLLALSIPVGILLAHLRH